MASINHNGVLGLLLLLIVTMFGASSSADTYTVGDDLGWTNPPLGNVAYSTWAKTKSFDIGDVLGMFVAFSYSNSYSYFFFIVYHTN